MDVTVKGQQMTVIITSTHLLQAQHAVPKVRKEGAPGRARDCCWEVGALCNLAVPLHCVCAGHARVRACAESAVVWTRESATVLLHP
jgi:hypothetical protein